MSLWFLVYTIVVAAFVVSLMLIAIQDRRHRQTIDVEHNAKLAEAERLFASLPPTRIIRKGNGKIIPLRRA